MPFVIGSSRRTVPLETVTHTGAALVPAGVGFVGGKTSTVTDAGARAHAVSTIASTSTFTPRFRVKPLLPSLSLHPVNSSRF
ncbi:MAG: hypothetical protein RMK99_08415 [Anaerolineales bacterium]|nr:hypothetical protein [Anaerolineales bacterium]